MWSWRSSASTISRWLAVASFIGPLALAVSVEAAGRKPAPNLEQSHEGLTLDIAVTLVGITAFQDFQELRAGLLKSEGVSKVAIDSEAPGLISMKVTYAGEPMSLIDKLSNFFPKKYDIREKRLPGGGTEVSVSRRVAAGA
jgi:hypothetical protein